MRKIFFIITISLVVCSALYIYIIMTIEDDKFLLEESNTKAIEEKIEQKETFVLFAYQVGCLPCNKMKPVLNKMFKINSNMYCVNINDESNDFDYVYNILKVDQTPTLLFIKEGIIENKISGIVSEDTVKENIERFIK